MTTKQELHHLVDELPDQALPEAARRLEPLRDPVLASLSAAPPDDEPSTPEENAGAAEAWEEYQRGEGRTLADVRAALTRRRA